MRFVTLIAELIEFIKEEIEHRQLEKKFRKQLKIALDNSDTYCIMERQGENNAERKSSNHGHFQ